MVEVVVLGDKNQPLEAMLGAFAEGVAEGGAEISVSALDRAMRREEASRIVSRVRAAAGVVLAAECDGPRATEHLEALRDAARAMTSEQDLIGLFGHSVGSSLVALPIGDERAREAVHVLNSQLYDMGALIVSPGFGARAVNPWYDNRPGGVDKAGVVAATNAKALHRHGRRLAWVIRLIERERDGLLALQL